MTKWSRRIGDECRTCRDSIATGSVQAEEGHKSSAMPAFGIEGVDEQEMKCNKPDTAAV